MTLLTVRAPNYRNPDLWETHEDPYKIYRPTGELVIKLTTNAPFVIAGQEYVWQTDLTIGHGGSELKLMARDGDTLRPAGYVKTTATNKVSFFTSPQSMDIAAEFTELFTRAAETDWPDHYSIKYVGYMLTFVPVPPSIPIAPSIPTARASR